jgi:HK97 family phage major capsid protein
MPTGTATNRSNITLPSEVSQEILQKTTEASAVMRLARRVTLPGRGLTIPMITSDPSAAWVAETSAKTVSNPGLSTKLMTAYKLAVIVPFSDEFRRDMRALYDALVARLPNALAKKFDATVAGVGDKPGDNFDNFANCTAQSILTTVSNTPYAGLVAAWTDIATHDGELNGLALSPAAMGLLLGAVDSTGRPIFTNAVSSDDVPRILGAPVYQNRGLYKAGVAPVGTGAGTPAMVGIAGDWTKAMFGTVEGVKIDLSNQATLVNGTETINLWQQNMFAVKAEIEVGFRADTDCFNRLLGATPSGA